MGFETLAVHAGLHSDPTTGAVVPPIYQTSTYQQDGVGGLRGGYEYSRTGNPTRAALEEAIAELEGGLRGFACASGMAAEDLIARVALRPGDHVVGGLDAYGGTDRLFRKVLSQWGIELSSVPLSDPGAVADAMRPTTKLVWCETPSNPLLGIVDIPAVAEIAHRGAARFVVDNTFATPYLQQPLALGADIVVHSTTKYLGGHSDVVGGLIVVTDPELGDQIAFHSNASGAIAGPFDAWLALRGIRTLAVRMDRHCDNAERVAAFLTTHPRVTKVYYPGLVDHPGHDIAAKQQRRFGGMVSFQVAGSATDVCAATQLFTLAESLGGVESLIELPAVMTHASVAESPLAVPADLIRLSVGIESSDDLIDDLRKALA